jgi:hypothetical protein
MKIIKLTTALWLVLLGQGNVLAQNWSSHLHLREEKDLHFKKITNIKTIKQSMSRLPNRNLQLVKNWLGNNQIESEILVNQTKIIASSEAEKSFNFSSWKSVWFGCCDTRMPKGFV